jgi:hypothetical protein
VWQAIRAFDELADDDDELNSASGSGSGSGK